MGREEGEESKKPQRQPSEVIIKTVRSSSAKRQRVETKEEPGSAKALGGLFEGFEGRKEQNYSTVVPGIEERGKNCVSLTSLTRKLSLPSRAQKNLVCWSEKPVDQVQARIGGK
jgi:hypothetical protein